jgi:hypothetical protein
VGTLECRLLTRNSSITGMSYKDNPIIVAWEVMNESHFQTDLSGIFIKLCVPYHVFSLVKRLVNLQCITQDFLFLYDPCSAKVHIRTICKNVANFLFGINAKFILGQLAGKSCQL